MQAPKPVARRSGASVQVEAEQVERPMFQDNRSVDLDADAHGGGGEDGMTKQMMKISATHRAGIE